MTGRPLASFFRILSFIALFTGTAGAQETWNPKPAPGDVLLPLPCDQKITFRRVVTNEAVNGAEGLLDDRRVLLGSAGRERAYVDYLHVDFIAGGFRDGARSFYLIGKYEVTVGQYQAVVAGNCQVAPDEADLPATRLSWYEASEFGRRLTAYLLANAKTELREAVGTTNVFIRLPTETEWEFAARGGLAVSISEFQAERFPMDSGLEDYAWFNNASALQEPSPIGELLPNELYLHDMYGNVAEMMFEPFRMNKAGRAHGLAGGVTLKGGSFLSNAAYVTSADRVEDALFNVDTGEERRVRDAGFRVVLASPALPTGAEVAALAASWESAGSARTLATQDPLVLIGQLRETVTDRQLANDLSSIEQAIRRQSSENAEDRKLLLSGLLTSLGTAVADMRRLNGEVEARRAMLRDPAAARKVLGAEAVERMNELNMRAEGEIRDVTLFAHDTVVRVGTSFPAEEVVEQARATAGELRQRGVPDAIIQGVTLGGDIAARARDQQGIRREDVRKLVIGGQSSNPP